jgi:hypothetical protein
MPGVRRSRLAGLIIVRLTFRSLEAGWARRLDGGRAVQVTPKGEGALAELLGLDPQTRRPHALAAKPQGVWAPEHTWDTEGPWNILQRSDWLLEPSPWGC